MFIEIKDPDLLLQYCAAGLLYDSCQIHNVATGLKEWDGPLYVSSTVEEIREVLEHVEASKYKFYISIEE